MTYLRKHELQNDWKNCRQITGSLTKLNTVTTAVGFVKLGMVGAVS
jgi:hypothetical protein